VPPDRPGVALEKMILDTDKRPSAGEGVREICRRVTRIR
jgi:hypothetical protein